MTGIKVFGTTPYQATGHVSNEMICRSANMWNLIIDAGNWVDTSLPLVLVSFSSQSELSRFTQNLTNGESTSFMGTLRKYT